MPKASQVLAALKRDGWREVRRKGSHRRLKKGDKAGTFAHHDSRDLGTTQLVQLARAFGYTVDELRKLL